MKYMLANWKMYTTVSEALDWLRTVQDGLRRRGELVEALPQPIVCPPFVSLVPMRAQADDQLVRLGAQNCHWEPEGPYTGEIAPTMLRGFADYVLLGHSERRAAGETDDQIAKKVAAVVECGLTPILFVGEDEPDDDAVSRSEQRLRLGLSGVDPGRHRVMVVYEPTWAVGGEKAAGPDHVRRVVEHLKVLLRQLGTSDPEVLYGGTVADDNVDEFVALEVLDGVGATRASLDPEGFLALIDRLGDPPPGRAADNEAVER